MPPGDYKSVSKSWSSFIVQDGVPQRFKWHGHRKEAAIRAAELKEEFKDYLDTHVMMGRTFPPGMPQNVKVA